MQSIAVGIDVSKESLDVYAEIAGKPWKARFANDGPGVVAFVAACPAGATVHLEATGGFERAVKNALVKAGCCVKVHNPRRIRRLADIQGVSAKTDSLDAKVLSHAGILNDKARSKSAEQEALCDLSRLIHRLKKELVGHRKRLGLPGLDRVVKSALERLIRTREKEIIGLEAQYVQSVKSSSRSGAYQLAQTVPCVGPGLARVLSAELPPDLSQWNSRQISSLAGVAPMDHASGKTARTSAISLGNTHLRAALYMPAMVAVQKKPWAKELYAKLRAKAKSHRQAITAVMRKLLVQVFTVLKRGSAWQPEPPMEA